MRTVRSVEQGVGRSVRGEKDYCVVIATGSDLVRMLRDRNTRKYLSPQMAAQVDLGFEIAEMAKQEIEDGDKKPIETLKELIAQCLRRDAAWKAFYIQRMDQIAPRAANEAILRTYAAELDAEKDHAAGDHAGATKKIQALLDGSSVESEDDKGWYLQEMARWNWRANRAESERLQIAAHKRNRMLLRPRSGVAVKKLEIVSQGRVERIAEWIRTCDNYSELDARISDILGNLVFGVKADRFESALNELSQALGFRAERPDKEWKEGPDNLWALNDTQYLLWECKNEVALARAEIDKREAEQMNRSSAWFEKYYRGCRVKRFIVHPSNRLHRAAAVTHDVEAVRVHELRKLVESTRAFFRSFQPMDFQDLSATYIQRQVDVHGLSVKDLLSNYSKKLTEQGHVRH